MWSKEKWSSWKNPFTKETADEVYDKWMIKIKVAEDLGFKVIQVYSSDNLKERYIEIEKIIEERLNETN